jgi:DNA polymerase III delta subunit
VVSSVTFKRVEPTSLSFREFFGFREDARRNAHLREQARSLLPDTMRTSHFSANRLSKGTSLVVHVYLMHGQNEVDLDERVEDIRRDLDPNSLASSVLDLTNTPLDEIRNACHSAPFFGSGRTVILRNVAATSSRSPRRSAGAPDWNDLLEVVLNSPDSSSIVLRADESLASTSVFVKSAKQHGWTIESFPVPRGDELARWVAERARATGVNIARNAATMLLSRLYPTSWRQESRFDSILLDTRLIATEIEKLACAASDGAIDQRTVEELVADRSGYTAFKLNDLIYSGQSEVALSELEQVLSSGEEPERVLAQVASEAAGLTAAGMIPDFDLPAVSRSAGMSEGRLRMLTRKPVSQDTLALKLVSERLRRAEWLVKTGRSPRSEAVIVATTAEVSEAVRRSRD